MISTQPGSQPLASFKVLSLEESHPIVHTSVGNDIGKAEISSCILNETCLLESMELCNSSQEFVEILYAGILQHSFVPFECVPMCWFQVLLARKTISKCLFKRLFPTQTACLFVLLQLVKGKLLAIDFGKKHFDTG